MSVKAVSCCICYFCGFIVIYSLYLFFPNGAEIITLVRACVLRLFGHNLAELLEERGGGSFEPPEPPLRPGLVYIYALHLLLGFKK